MRRSGRSIRYSPAHLRGAFFCPQRKLWGVAALALALPSFAADAEAVRFVDVAESAGLRFAHVNGMAGKRWIVETVGPGAAVFDFDQDGRLDVWLVQGGPLQSRRGNLPGDALFRNTGGDGELRFEDVTAASGVRASGYGMAIASGDIDNDGDWDVFLANYGANQLFENLGGGRFRDITEQSGLSEHDEWSAAASFADYDQDGLLDLYVGNYLRFDIASHKTCRDMASRPAYCAPSAYAPVADRLYRNLGERRFADASESAGLGGAPPAPALGVVAEDLNGDGRVDFYVANDGAANHLWLNRGGGETPRFGNDALLSGVAFNGNGAAEASMGIAAEDFDGDCDIDLFVTHLGTETNTLYVNHGGWFADATNQAGLAASSAPFTGFGTAWFDAENDGDLDLFSANGAVRAIPAQRDAGEAFPLRERNQLWLNDGQGRYAEHPGGPAFADIEASRGAAFGDLDNDGDVDIVVANSAAPVRLYRNDSAASAWLGIDLRGADNAPIVGAGVWLESRQCTRRRIATDGSYASASDPRVVFGLGTDTSDQTVRVQWPNRAEERFGPLAPNRYHVLREGTGTR